MPEYRTFTFEVYRTPDGEPTCSAKAGEQDCKYLMFRKWGTMPICGDSGHELYRRGPDGTGYLIPDRECLMWYGEAK